MNDSVGEKEKPNNENENEYPAGEQKPDFNFDNVDSVANFNLSEDSETVHDNTAAASSDNRSAIGKEQKSNLVALTEYKSDTNKTVVQTQCVKHSGKQDKNASEDGDKKVKKGKGKKKHNLWSLKITIISLFLSAFISFISEMTASGERVVVTVLLLFFLILASILFDGIGVAVTSCDITPIIAMASRKIYGAKTAMWLVKNNEKVSNVCNDVIGDIFGIISGACTAAIVMKVVIALGDDWQRWLTIGFSSIVAALTIGGKAFLKNFAITNSKEFVMFISRIIAIFSPEERRRKKKQNTDAKKYGDTGGIQKKADRGNQKSDVTDKKNNASKDNKKRNDK